MYAAANSGGAISDTTCPAERRATTRRFVLLTVLATAVCCHACHSIAGEFAAPSQGPLAFRASTATPVVDDQVVLTGGPELLPVAGPSVATVDQVSNQVSGRSFEELLDRIDRQDRIIADLTQRLDAQQNAPGVPTFPTSANMGSNASIYSSAYASEPGCGCPKPTPVYAPLVGNADNGKCPPCGEEKKLKKQHVVSHYVGYDKGFVIQPFNMNETPFSMKINGMAQLRYHGFARDHDTWTDNAGVTHEIRNRSAFDIERARLLFTGTAIDPRSTYRVYINGDTDQGHFLDFYDYWWAWKFNDLLQVQVGKRKVAAVRQWLMSAFETTFVGRSIATNFFRPNRTVGVWFRGDLTEKMHYEAMVGNGLNTSTLNLTQENDKFAYAATQWIDLGNGDFGKSYDDFDWHRTAVAQLGHSFAAGDQGDTLGGVPLNESDFVRLSDGTVLDSPNALAPGTRVTDYELYLYSVDAAWKYRGWAINGEFYFRWIQDISGMGNIPVDHFFDRGYVAQTSYYLVPKKVYVGGRISEIDGAYGTRHEYAGVVGWFINGNPQMKLTFDVVTLDGAPLNNTPSDIRVGDHGFLCRTQYQVRF